MNQYFIIEEDDSNNFLCCCEYVNLKNQRSHLLGCLCDCEHVDEYFDRTMTGRSMPADIHLNMYRVIQDRCRIPWRGGAKTVPLDVVLPTVLLPLFALVASVNVWCTFITFLLIPFIIFYAKKFYGEINPRSKFFLSWSVTSAISLLLIFEFIVIPRLEILPSENFVFIVLLMLGISLLCAARFTSTQAMGDEEGSNQACKVCRIKCPQDTMHCSICDHCVLRADYHCYWLDCCIGSKNVRKFLTGSVLTTCALFLYSYLVLTTACHPFLLMDSILVPDDCSDVFYDFYIALCFVGGAYSFIVAVILSIAIVRHLFLALLGYSLYEWSQIPSHEKKCCFPGSSKSKRLNLHV
ncbi:palmitoyltransferase ZDHHC23-B [Cloeon dipterum]|uniref:palmitoyltransferase ZDHHC23-B n=1 Tax=Cloeon dipterum TaxID=197152 RepID=UPI00322007FA